MNKNYRTCTVPVNKNNPTGTVPVNKDYLTDTLINKLTILSSEIALDRSRFLHLFSCNEQLKKLLTSYKRFPEE